jgi:hypothetical protein
VHFYRRFWFAVMISFLVKPTLITQFIAILDNAQNRFGGDTF